MRTDATNEALTKGPYSTLDAFSRSYNPVSLLALSMSELRKTKLPLNCTPYSPLTQTLDNSLLTRLNPVSIYAPKAALPSILPVISVFEETRRPPRDGFLTLSPMLLKSNAIPKE